MVLVTEATGSGYSSKVRFHLATISFWLKEVVKFAMTISLDDQGKTYSMTTSWGQNKNMPLADLMKAVGWRHSTNFFTHYLRYTT